MQYIIAIFLLLVGLAIVVDMIWTVKRKFSRSILYRGGDDSLCLIAPATSKNVRGLELIYGMFMSGFVFMTGAFLHGPIIESELVRELSLIFSLYLTSIFVLSLIKVSLIPWRLVFNAEGFSSTSFSRPPRDTGDVRIPWSRVRSVRYSIEKPDTLVLAFQTEKRRPVKVELGLPPPEHLAAIQQYVNRVLGGAPAESPREDRPAGGE